MATSGKLNTTAWKGNHGTRYLELAWERTAIDIAAQTSTIKWTLTSRGTYTGYVMSAPFRVYIDGESVYSSDTRIKLYTNQQVATGTKVIKHNTDGTKTFAASVSAALYLSSINATGSGTYALDLVGMATLTKAPNFNDEENPVIEYYNPVGTAISSLQAAISLTGETPDIAYRDIPIASGSYTFTLTDAERKILRAATQGGNSRKVRFYLRNVVNGSILFSWKEVSYTVINANPTITAGVVDSNAATIALTGDNTTLIRYHSTAYAAFTATAYKEATIKTHVIEYNGGITSSSEKTVANVESNVFTFISADSRGNTANETIVAPMIDYIKPTVNIDTSIMMDTTGYYPIKCSGNYYNDTFGYTDAAAANTLTVYYRYKQQGGSYNAWATMGTTKSGNTYTAEAALRGLNYRNTYIVQCKIVDKLNTVESAEITIRSLPVFHWSDTDFTFEVPVNFNAGATGIEGGTSGGSIGNNVVGDMEITGNLRLKGSGNYGNTLFFGDGSYAYISEPTDDALTIKASTINLNGNVLVNGSSIGSSSGSSNATAGSWTPTLTTAAAVSSYSVRQGWYSKVGNVITIGWQIKATINSGYNNTLIGISGCPYTPFYAAFGGGIAHNCYFISGFNFEGYGIGTDGVITLRGQPCNMTVGGNLSITSSAYYPTGSGNVLTLAGTITFTI
jgi:hypothetical protein